MRSVHFPRPQGPAPALAVLACGVLLVHIIAAAAVLATVARGDGVGDWVSFYAAGTLVRTGHGEALYDFAAQTAVQRSLFGDALTPNAYPLPAFVAVVVAPLTLLSFAASYWPWLCLNIAALALLARAAWRHLGGASRGLRIALVACGALSTPVVTTLLLGQVDLFVLGSMVGCYALLRRERPFTAGAVLALALAKPHVAAAVVLLLLVKREWRALAGLAAVGLPLLVAPTLMFGPDVWRDQIALIASYPGSSTEHSVMAGMMVNVRGAVVSITGSNNVWLWAVPLSWIAGASIWAAISAWRRADVLAPQSWALALALPLLYSPHLHVQTLVLLVAAAVLFARAAVDAGREPSVAWVLLAYIGVGALWMLGIAGVSLLFAPVLLAFAALVRRWPERAAVEPAATLAEAA